VLSTVVFNSAEYNGLRDLMFNPKQEVKGSIPSERSRVQSQAGGQGFNPKREVKGLIPSERSRVQSQARGQEFNPK